MTSTPAVYEFGDFTLDVSQRRLLRRASQVAIPLTAKVFDTLQFLVEHAEETLDKDVLMRAIWPDVIVEENSLAQNISTLRQVLGDARGEHRYIVTIPRKGYRFVAQVKRADQEVEAAGVATTRLEPQPSIASDNSKRQRRYAGLIAAGITVLLLAVVLGPFLRPATSLDPQATNIQSTRAQSLAILPFKPLTPAERNESLELGMTDSLIASLARQSPGQITGKISPLSSVRRYSALDQDAIAAGHELGVDTVLDGSLQRRGERLRVSVRLLRVSDGRQLWAENFDQEFTTIFEVQDAIAAKVARALSVRWVDPSSRGDAYTRNPEAYALYASGNFAWTQQSETSLQQAIGYFEQAIVLDPSYALAYCGLADSYALLGVFGIRAPHEVFPLALSAAQKALALDPDLAAAHSALGHIKVQYERDWEGAAREYARALRLDPTVALTHHRIGLLYAMQGDLDRALAASERAQQLEPLWLAGKAATSNYLYYAKRYDEAIRAIERVLALESRMNARGSLIRSLIGKGDFARALAEYDRLPLQAPGSYAFRAQALAGLGRRDEATAELARVKELATHRYVAAYDIAMIYAALSDTENALTWLEKAIEDRSTLVNLLAQDPVFEALHGDKRFESLVQRIGIYRRVLPETT